MEQADLVRALESIDHTDILAHHVNLQPAANDNFLQEHQVSLQTPVKHIDVSYDDPHHGQQISRDAGPSEQTEQQHHDDDNELDTWTREQLQAEIIKLRRLAKASNINESISQTVIEPRQHASSPRLTQSDDTALVTDTQSGKVKRKRKRNGESDAAVERKEIKRHESTGKRLEKDRKTELAKAVRVKMRSYIGVGMDDPLPHPYSPSTESEGGSIEMTTRLFVPEWSTQLNNPTNSSWVHRISQEIYQEGLAGLHPKIPTEDIDMDIIDTTVKTAFVNMCKKYGQENDPNGVARRDRYTKKRRRWARKDLKQKRRTRTAADPAFQDIHLPPSALHIDYMSSEYSSEGDNSEGETEEGLLRRKEQWDVMRTKQAEEEQPVINGKGGWAVGISEKILEVRTPRWRSEALNEIYRRLDAHATQFSDTRASGSSRSLVTKPNDAPNVRPGHVAPSHRRFTMPPGTMRKGGTPRDLGEGWMWASGMGGVWPEEAARWIGEGPFAPATQPDVNMVPPVDHDRIINDEIVNGNSLADHSVNGDLDIGVEGIEGGHELEQARLGLVNALEGLG
ncbi:uncharacterized protein I303_105630 [Kwoniella dejecticola CBS 10117]|uniref:Uncharacterized protein n=1 Tax=Kwoniella dejecticola CBS 10117 TaxID=1296121 RepID=A0A1A6A1Y3_9TREE|nr:uncharacterized protein I303_04926 [Kwoniella dejecticola CBS 10117]OBR84070.1 hypothetical protein I303_04926 [Kwoniella dejecticola CBS 10117]